MRLSLKTARNVWQNFWYTKNDSKDWYYDILQYRTSLKFWGMFRVFHLRAINSSRSRNNCCGWRKLLRKVEHGFTLNSVKLLTQGERGETSTQNLQRSNVVRHVLGFCISYFAAFCMRLFGATNGNRKWFRNKKWRHTCSQMTDVKTEVLLLKREKISRLNEN